MSASTIDYAQLAAQSGAIASTPAPQAQSAPPVPASGGGVDYDALAVQSGAINHFEGSGQTTNDTGNTVITPKEGESFADTMNRAAAFGKTPQAKAEAAKESTAKNLGTKAAETVAAAPVIGAAGAASLAGAGAAGEQAIEWTPKLIKAVQAAAESHPVIAKLIVRGLEGTAVGAGLKLAKILPSQ